jgi:uncharacterized HAD superfamily protein
MTSISFCFLQSKYVNIVAISKEIMMISKKILFENTIENALDTEKNNKKVVTSAAIPNDFFLLCNKYFDIIKVRINRITGNNIIKESISLMVITYFVHFF